MEISVPTVEVSYDGIVQEDCKGCVAKLEEVVTIRENNIRYF